MARRKHSAEETRDTLRLLQSRGLNFSLDLLFALPTQSLDQVERDLEEILRWNPPHVSPYCLTVPEGHVFSKGRAADEIQVAMFDAIEKALTGGGLQRYEISNFAKPGFESRHNLLYWNDDEYWGVGLSSHSYLKNSNGVVAFGIRAQSTSTFAGSMRRKAKTGVSNLWKPAMESIWSDIKL